MRRGIPRPLGAILLCYFALFLADDDEEGWVGRTASLVAAMFAFACALGFLAGEFFLGKYWGFSGIISGEPTFAGLMFLAFWLLAMLLIHFAGVDHLEKVLGAMSPRRLWWMGFAALLMTVGALVAFNARFWV